ncbi:uncharacterized protein J3D65DRAFT_631808 [Phyllosticta citribraziliensis]|uniref:HOOK N-terminal domain-containing protein n=1 Tax=Phyllosticta citribraziliensis TaxID=989973 RepID=A0ABR1LFC8_9PEZI
MDTTSPELETALLAWVNRFRLSKPVESWAELKDGQVLWQILHEVDPEYFKGDLPEATAQTSDSWIPRWQNSKRACLFAFDCHS